ncbi:MAG: peroxiredoxin family protein [Actinomycetota bacterium]
MQQVVDLQEDPEFQALDVEVLSISPDPVTAWWDEGEAFGITMPTLSDPGNVVASRYGVMRWGMPSNEPGHTFVLIDTAGKVAWIKDYGAPEHGGLMYVPPDELATEIDPVLSQG